MIINNKIEDANAYVKKYVFHLLLNYLGGGGEVLSMDSTTPPSPFFVTFAIRHCSELCILECFNRL